MSPPAKARRPNGASRSSPPIVPLPARRLGEPDAAREPVRIPVVAAMRHDLGVGDERPHRVGDRGTVGRVEQLHRREAREEAPTCDVAHRHERVERGSPAAAGEPVGHVAGDGEDLRRSARMPGLAGRRLAAGERRIELDVAPDVERQRDHGGQRLDLPAALEPHRDAVVALFHARDHAGQADVETRRDRLDQAPRPADERHADVGPAGVQVVAVVDRVEDQRQDPELGRPAAAHRRREREHGVAAGLRRRHAVQPRFDRDIQVGRPGLRRALVRAAETRRDPGEVAVEQAHGRRPRRVPVVPDETAAAGDEHVVRGLRVRAHREPVAGDLRRDRRLRIGVDPGAAELDLDVGPGQRRRPGPAAESVTRLEDDDPSPRRGHVPCRDQPRQAAADHDDVHVRHDRPPDRRLP